MEQVSGVKHTVQDNETTAPQLVKLSYASVRARSSGSVPVDDKSLRQTPGARLGSHQETARHLERPAGPDWEGPDGAPADRRVPSWAELQGSLKMIGWKQRQADNEAGRSAKDLIRIPQLPASKTI